MLANMHSILQNHVSLTVSGIDRIYLSGYVPKLQTSGQLCFFLRDHLGYPIPSPALFRPMHDRFVRAVQDCAAEQQIPVIHFERGQRKDAIAAGYRARFTQAEGIVLIGVAQERAISFKAQEAHGEMGRFFNFSRQPVSVNHYYFYVQDPAWGPAFVKVGTYLPYPVRVCLNGHRVGQAAIAAGGDRLREPRQRLSLVPRPGAAAGDLRCVESGGGAGLL